ncbi:hypothetical protein C3Y08_11140 [Burkholderia gladioli]|uniref:hypothetical protein n=1 Tax=Burkholderia gladioli TaxID=28095 RepID=UPI000CDAEF33|nr:hypothetical protein [Burkholderia gladioli]POS08042.1 hypothetical protein C3Y08_11140 [Burkholderia gladioli]
MSIERYTADEALQDVDDVLEKYLMPIGISKADALDRIIHVVNRYLVAKPADGHAAAPASAWVPKADSLPTEPGWYLVMLAPDNDWELMSDTPLQVEFGAYKNKPQSFTIFYNDAPGEDITAAVTHWMRMPPAPGAQVDAPKDASEHSLHEIQKLLREVDPKWRERGEFGVKPIGQILRAIRDLAATVSPATAVERTLLKRASQALAWAPLASIPDGWAIHDDIVRHLASQPANGAEQAVAAGDEPRS